MSLKYRDSQGSETPVAGLNGTSGELVPSVALMKHGVAAIGMPNTSSIDQLFTTTVTFDTPFEDTDYVLNVDQCEVSEAEINRVYNKTVNGFTVAVKYNRQLTAVPSYNVTARIPWQAFKLMTDKVHEADSTHIAQNTANFAPAFSEVTSYAVGDYVTYNNILYRCTTAHTAGVWVAGHFTRATVGDGFDRIAEALSSIKDALFPVGSVYMTIGDTSPATLLGFGTWSKLSDGYLRAGGSAATGGSLTTGGHSITAAEMPSHSHTIAHTHSVRGNTGAMSAHSTGSVGGGMIMMNSSTFKFNGTFVDASGNFSLADYSGSKSIMAIATDQEGLYNSKEVNLDVSHTHPIELTSGNPSNANSGSTGSGSAHTHSIEPTYTRIYAWQRTA